MARKTSTAKLEAMREALLQAQACILIDRMNVADSELRPDGTYPPEAQHTLAEYDETLQAIEQALKGPAC